LFPRAVARRAHLLEMTKRRYELLNDP